MQPDPTSPLDLEAIKKRADEATPGPWHVGAGWVYTEPVYADDNRLSNVLGTKYADHDRAAAEAARVARNVEFIAYARRDVPALLAALAEAQRELRAAMDLLAATWTERDAARADAERMRQRLRDADNDLLDVRGVLSPNGYEPVTPLPLVPTVAPAVGWLADQFDQARGAGWSSIADLHAAYVDVLARWQRAEPVLEAAKEIVFDWWKQVAAGETFDDDVLPLEAALVTAVDTYETQEGTNQ